MEKIGLVRTRDGKSFLVPFILITSLFFLWGVAHSILDVLNKHFQDTLEITRTRSALIQAVVYGGYFIMAAAGGTDYPPLRLPHRGADGPGAVWHRGVAVHSGRTDSVV